MLTAYSDETHRIRVELNRKSPEHLIVVEYSVRFDRLGKPEKCIQLPVPIKDLL
jgi:hypothetical protein